MKSRLQFVLIVLLLGFSGLMGYAGFSSLYIFGDSLSTTTDNIPSSFYYGKRYSNGRVWAEVLAQMQGIPFSDAKNFSYWDHNSSLLTNEIGSFSASDASSSLFIVWVCNADTFDAASGYLSWGQAILRGTNNHLKIINSLYNQGARTLIMPNAVDISKIPAFNQGDTSGMSSGCAQYNAALSNVINQAKLLHPDLKIIAPDYFTLMNNVLSTPSAYGLINVSYNGYSLDALSAFNYGYPAASINGYGTNYVFWDSQDPTAKLHYTMGQFANSLISPPIIKNISVVNGSNRLDLVNLPLATVQASNCVVLYATNLNQTVWQTNLPGFSTLTATQSLYLPKVGSQHFYRIKSSLVFPPPWLWP